MKINVAKRLELDRLQEQNMLADANRRIALARHVAWKCELTLHDVHVGVATERRLIAVAEDEARRRKAGR